MKYKDGGRYYKQGEILRYKPEEDIVYNDTFQKSLHDILINKKIESVPHVRRVLDANGYIGRATPHRIYNKNIPTGNIKISVELIWSGIKYLWPIDGVYCMSSNRVQWNTVAPPVVTREALELLYQYLSASPYLLRDKLGISLEIGNKMIEELVHAGIINTGELSIVDDNELNEVYENLIKKC